MDKTIYKLDMHEECAVNFSTTATRVPGGWIYTMLSENENGGFDMAACFVPYNDDVGR